MVRHRVEWIGSGMEGRERRRRTSAAHDLRIEIEIIWSSPMIGTGDERVPATSSMNSSGDRTSAKHAHRTVDHWVQAAITISVKTESIMFHQIHVNDAVEVLHPFYAPGGGPHLLFCFNIQRRSRKLGKARTQARAAHCAHELQARSCGKARTWD